MCISVFFSSDNDECSIGTHNCPQICTNTEGSFYCGCNTGFQWNSDGATCDGDYYMKQNMYYKIIHTLLDIDECSDGTHYCSQTCTNTVGSFTCGCNNGYLLDVDGTTCNSMYKPLVLFW